MTAAEIFARWKATGKVRRKDLLKILAFIYVKHRPLGAPHPVNITMPTEVLDMIAQHVAGGAAAWLDACNEQRTKLATQVQVDHQAKADEIWAEKPYLSKRRVALLIQKQDGGNADTIRKALIKK
jgi:hypothetical protein